MLIVAPYSGSAGHNIQECCRRFCLQFLLYHTCTPPRGACYISVHRATKRVDFNISSINGQASMR